MVAAYSCCYVIGKTLLSSKKKVEDDKEELHVHVLLLLLLFFIPISISNINQIECGRGPVLILDIFAKTSILSIPSTIPRLSAFTCLTTMSSHSKPCHIAVTT